MLNCKDISKLVSESLDYDLPMRKKMAVKMHIMMCSMCRAYVKQNMVLREAVRKYGRMHEKAEAKLPASSAEKIKQALEKERSTSKNDTA